MTRRTEIAFAAVLTALGTALAVATPALTGGGAAGQPYYARASFFPWIGLAFIVVFGGWSTWQAWRGVERDLSDEIEAGHTSVRLALGGAFLLGLYVLLCAAFGYALSTFAALCLLGLWVGLPRRLLLLLALVTTALLYGVFVYGFKVWFAPSWIERLWS